VGALIVPPLEEKHDKYYLDDETKIRMNWSTLTQMQDFSTSLELSASFKDWFTSSAWIMASLPALTSSSGVLANGYNVEGMFVVKSG
jgi:hypothetical protein